MSVICCFKARQPWRGCAVIRLSSKQPEVFNSSAITWPITALPDPDIANTRLCPTFIPINHSFCATCHNLFYVPLTACIPGDYLTTQSYQLTMGAVDMVGDKKKSFSQMNKEQEVGAAPLQTTCTLVRTHSHTYPSILPCVRTKEGRPRLTVTNGDWYCSKLQEEPAHLTKVKHRSLSPTHTHTHTTAGLSEWAALQSLSLMIISASCRCVSVCVQTQFKSQPTF